MYIAFNSIQVVLELNSDLGACYFIIVDILTRTSLPLYSSTANIASFQ